MAVNGFDPRRYEVRWEDTGENSFRLYMEVPTAVANHHREEIAAYLNELTHHALRTMRDIADIPEVRP